MAALDSTTEVRVFHGAAAIQLTDGTNTVTVAFQGEMSWERTGRTVSEARDRNRHKSTPVLTEAEDGNISISLSGKITSYLGSSNAHLYEVLTGTGQAASWTPTANGNAHSFRLIYTSLSSAAAGGNQTLTFNYCHCESQSINLNGDGGHEMLDASITDYENDPTIA